MYKHILIATDGSDIANKAIPHAIAQARAFGAKLSAVTISEPYDAVIAAESHGDYNERSAENAAEILSFVTATAEGAGIECDAIHEQSRVPYEGIIAAAKNVDADLIVVGSHGRRGVEGLLLGSQASKLLTHSKTATLVVR